MDLRKRMLEYLGLPADGLEPLVTTSRIEVDRQLLRDYYRHALAAPERRVVLALVGTYQDWHDAHLEVIRELGLEAGAKERPDDQAGATA